MGYCQYNTGHEMVMLPLERDVRKVYLEVTTFCNFTCITCIRHSWLDKVGHMSQATFNKLIKDMQELPNLETVHFGGFGEPLSHPHIMEMIAACKEAGYRVEMITNGSLLTSEVGRKLVEIGLDWLYVSLDGSDASCFEQIRPGASFEDITGKIQCLQHVKQLQGKEHPQLGIAFVATKQNFDKLPAMRRVVDGLGAHRFNVTNVMPYHESMKEQILYDKAIDFNQFGHESALLSIKTAPNMELRTQRTCRFVEDKTMSVTFEGNISPCYALMHNYSCYILGRKKEMIAHSFGNSNERAVGDIWASPEYAIFRWIVRNALYPSCTDCRQVDGCVMAQSNEMDCWGIQPSCGDCLWAREIIACP